jgi:hypothetical protein
MRNPDHVVDLPLKYINDERYKILDLRRAESDGKAKAETLAAAGEAGLEKLPRATAQARSTDADISPACE